MKFLQAKCKEKYLLLIVKPTLKAQTNKKNHPVIGWIVFCILMVFCVYYLGVFMFRVSINLCLLMFHLVCVVHLNLVYCYNDTQKKYCQHLL